MFKVGPKWKSDGFSKRSDSFRLLPNPIRLLSSSSSHVLSKALLLQIPIS